MCRLLPIAALVLAAATLALGTQPQQQQPWQIPADANARVWSLSSQHTHQRAFPPRLRTDTLTGARGTTAGPDHEPSHALPTFLAHAPSAKLHWTLTNANGSINVDALLPSLAHLDLLRAGIIDEPAIGLNEGWQRWIIDEPSWTYTADLAPILQETRPQRDEAGSKAVQSHEYWLYFEGLDTVADVLVGGEHILHTHNQHTWHTVRIPPHLWQLGKGHTNLTLVFNNTNEYAADQARRFDPGYPNQVDSPTRSRTSDYEYPHRTFVRKQQSDFGWDWGPALVPVGPHKPAYLLELPTASHAAVEDPQPAVHVISWGVDIYRKGQTNNLPPPDAEANWILNVSLTLLASHSVPWPAVRISLPLLGVYTFDTLLSSHTVEAGLNAPLHATFEIPSSGHYAPELWWPRGYGEPTLYELVVQSDELQLQLQRRVGFRTAVLDLSSIPPTQASAEGVMPGSHFRLLINGREVYVIGTSLIPLDTLGPRTSRAYLRWLLDSAAHAHVNLVRIWGGGSYPPPDLLAACDEMGVLVWLDVMFAASLYAYHDEFVRDVRTEVAQIVTSLVAHPCLVALVGNNEGELYFLGGYGRRARDDEWKRGYERLFDHAVRDQVLRASRALSYIPCSTTTGYLSLDPYQGRYDRYPHGRELHGTGEHYGYEAARAFEIDTYPRVRFVVEFGMFSLPSVHALESILPPGACATGNETDECTVDSTVVRAHLKHPPAGNLSYPFDADEGMQQLCAGVLTYFPDPAHSGRRGRELLRRWSESSQLYHALYVANQVAVYRRGAAGRERNRGLIVWQLNDVWQGTTWASVEYSGAWKLAHYLLATVQAAAAPMAVYNATDDSLELGVAFSGAPQHAGAYTVHIEWFDFKGTRLGVRGYKIELKQQHSDWHRLEQLQRARLCPGTTCYVRLDLDPLERTKEVVTTYWTHMASLTTTLTSLAHHGFRPRLGLHALPPDDDSPHWRVRVANTGTATAPWVTLTPPPSHPGFFSLPNTHLPTNAFFLNPNTSLILTFHPPNSSSSSSAAASQAAYAGWFAELTVSSLFDNLAAT